MSKQKITDANQFSTSLTCVQATPTKDTCVSEIEPLRLSG